MRRVRSVSNTADAVRRLESPAFRRGENQWAMLLQMKKKSLGQRQHECLECGYTTHRDTAAAEVILARMEPSNANIAATMAV